MASVKVAVRLRPLNKREIDMESKVVIEMEEKKTRILNSKHEHSLGDQQAFEKWKEFSFDHSYWSVDKKNAKYASQEQVFKDLGVDVVDNAYEGYNSCVFAYGQTGSGKTYTMMGNPDDQGLIPRICFELFHRMKDESMTYRCEVSYLEIYNEKVRDLLKSNTRDKAIHSLRVREHPKNGPYVQDLSKHLVQNYKDIEELMQKGSQTRTTASTNMNDVSSRSHAIFTLVFTQAKFSKESPLETHSKLHLVDLAGSERADATGATGQRLKEGGSINKSLVTLGNVISALADLSSTISGHRRTAFIPYRDSVLTWLLKDSLGGNSKTMMIATISPAQCNYPETLSTLRYANRAKDIINKPTVNEDPNVKLIRELRSEIARLKALLGGNIDSLVTPKVKEKLHENEAKIKVLTQEWAGRWSSVADILEEEKSLALRKEGLGVVLDSELPHLIGIDDDLLSTGIMLYHLNEGVTSIGNSRAEEKPDIVLQGPDVEPQHCTIEYAQNGDVTLIPGSEAPCSVNGQTITEPTVLVQGAVILLGQTNMFRFNHPAQAAQLRKEYQGAGLSLSRYSLLSQSMTDLCRSTDNLALNVSEEYETKYAELLEQLEEKRHEVSMLEERYQEAEKERAKALSEKEAELQLAKERLDLVGKGLDGEEENLEEKAKLAEEKSRLQEMIREELDALIKKEADRMTKAERKKLDFEKELEEVRRKHEEEKRYLEEQNSKLSKERLEISKKLDEINNKFEKREQEIREMQQQIDVTQVEIKVLMDLRGNFKDYAKVHSQLSPDAASKLEGLYETLMNLQNDISRMEKNNYEEYCREKEAILASKRQAMDDVAKEREQLEADKIYTQECGEKLSLALQNGEMDEEKYNREKQALDEENARIKQEWENLALVEKESEIIEAEDLKQLEEKRAEQVIHLNQEKEKLRDMLPEWDSILQECHTNSEKACLDLQSSLQSMKSSHKILQEEYEAAKRLEEEKLSAINKAIEQGNTAVEESIKAWQDEYERYECKVKATEEELANQIQEIQDRQQLLNSIDIAAVRNLTELHKIFVLLGFQFTTPQTPDNEATADQLKKIVRQESQVKEVMEELENVKVDSEIARERDLDAIDTEKYNLNQLEEQERINSLVDQEMRKRAFQERVEREKQLRIERERDKAERDRELSKIKRAHEKELSRMKDKMRDHGVVMENSPTRANPYASVMSGDATPVGSQSSTRKLKAKSMTNLARTQSITSLSSNMPTKPIKIAVPGFVARGAGLNTHIEYEVKISVLDEGWSVFRRYSKFRELHMDLKKQFPEVAALVFPPKRWFSNKSDRVSNERRILLEVYLSHVIDTLQTDSNYPLHPSHTRIYSKQVLSDFHPFFKKGIFEHSQHGTS